MDDWCIEALTQMMNTVTAGDAKGYARLYAQDAVITIYGGVELKGRDAIEQYEVELMRDFPGTRFALYSVWQTGSVAVVHYGVNGRTAGGQAMGHEGLLFYRFDPTGLIVEERRYLDSLTPMAQMGMLGAAPARPLPNLPAELKAYVAKGSPAETANVTFVRAGFAALDSRNESAFLSHSADDAALDEMILPHAFIGKRSVERWFTTWTTAFPDSASQVTTILGVEEFVLVETVVRGTRNGALGRLAASNKPFSVHRAAIVRMKDGKLKDVAAFMNGKELAEAVGQWPPPIGK